MTTLEKAQRIVHIAARSAKTAQGRNAIAAIELHTHGYAEPGYDDPASGIVALGNWNNTTRYEDGQTVTLDDSPSRVARLLEKIGVQLQWADDWMACQHCGKLIRVQPDSYGWQPSYHLDEDGPTCLECLEADAASYLEGLEGNPRRCNTVRTIDPADHGYVLIEDAFENGLHPGQNADPKIIAEGLERQGIRRYLFNLDSTGQFAISFSVHVHQSELHMLNQDQAEAARGEGTSV